VVATRPAETSGLAIASFVLSLVGFFVFPFVPSVAAVVLGYRARADIRSDPSLAGEGWATAGIVLGWIGIVLVPLMILLAFLLFGAFFAGVSVLT
jgi:hypothetical protein